MIRLVFLGLLAGCAHEEAVERAAWDAEYTAVYEMAWADDLDDLEPALWTLGDFGAPFAARVEAVDRETERLRERVVDSLRKVSASPDRSTLEEERAALRNARNELLRLREAHAALTVDLVEAQRAIPSSIHLADVRSVSTRALQQIFAVAGWSKPGAAVIGLGSGGYSNENFDVRREGVELNIAVLRPDASDAHEGFRPLSPTEMAARAKPETVFRYHEATDIYVEIQPGHGATVDDARALLAQVIPD